MSYGQGVKRQYCPIQNFLNFFCRVSLKIAKNGEFLLFSKLLEILIWKHISRVPPCHSSRPELSENVVVFGPRSFWTGVIAAQSWHTAEILGPLPKIRGVTKKQHSETNEFWGLKRRSGRPNHVTGPWSLFRLTKISIEGVLFFCDTSGSWFFSWNLTRLWQPITMA